MIAGCATLPEYRDDPLTTADVIRHIKCELRDAAWSHPENKWVRHWTAGLIFSLEVTHTGGLDTESAWTFPLNHGASFVIALTGGLSGSATRLERMTFKEAIAKLSGVTGPDCTPEEPGRYARLGGKLGIADLLERVNLTTDMAKIKLMTSLDYNLDFVIKKNAGVTPRFSLIPIGKEKTFTGSLKWTGSYSDTQALKLTLTPPADACELEDVYGQCPSPVFTVATVRKACERVKTKGLCTERTDCEWVVGATIDICQHRSIGRKTKRDGRERMVPSMAPPSVARGVPRAGESARGVTRGDEERNDRAQGRNVLESIEGELRRQRGN